MSALFECFLKRNKLESKPFQIECFKWSMDKEQSHIVRAAGAAAAGAAEQVKGGGILALEMGLGKTIIMLGLVKCNLKKHTLIVLPLALIEQWEKNIIKFCAYTPLVYHGSRPKNMQLTLEQIKTHAIVITTYGQISLPSLKQSSKGRRVSLLHQMEWNRLICDEAHHVSHKKTNEFKGVQLIKTELCWLVTGTPLQNNEKELYTLYSLYGLPDSKTYYNTGDNYIKTFNQMTFYRTKKGAGLVLPPLHEHIIRTEWENEAESEYAWHVHSLLPFCHVPQQPPAAKIETETENKNAMRMKYMARAQQVCVLGGAPPRPPQVSRVEEGGMREVGMDEGGMREVGMDEGGMREVGKGGMREVGMDEGGMREVGMDEGGMREVGMDEGGMREVGMDEGGINPSYQTLPVMGVVGGIPLGVPLSKIAAVLKTLLERKANGCGKLVFCHYYAEIDIIADYLHLADPALKIAKFDGRVPNSKRAEILSQPVDILLAQIKMCREGLNLQDNYNEVYLPSPHFNPATEQQAIARCWRMGQQKEVNVFRYIMGGNPPYVVKEDSLTMDMFSMKLHEKKREFVERMASAAHGTETHGTETHGTETHGTETHVAHPKKLKIKY